MGRFFWFVLNQKNRPHGIQKRDLKEDFPKVVTKVGRNDLCPCQSGKKYKKCCGKVTA
ncbi:SEC-C metal-binding domain-containing protein [Fredinandcohnia humi]